MIEWAGSAVKRLLVQSAPTDHTGLADPLARRAAAQVAAQAVEQIAEEMTEQIVVEQTVAEWVVVVVVE